MNIIAEQKPFLKPSHPPTPKKKHKVQWSVKVVTIEDDEMTDSGIRKIARVSRERL